jgi:hypothetical protein
MTSCPMTFGRLVPCGVTLKKEDGPPLGTVFRRDTSNAGGELTNILKRLVEHTAIAIAGGVICSMLAGLAFDGVLCALGSEGTIRRLASAWYGPAIWWPGTLGFFVNRRMLHRAACFVWLPGLVWLALGILSMATSSGPVEMSSMAHLRVELFPMTRSDYDACALNQCLGPLLWTWPALSAVTYSIGAALGLLSQSDRRSAYDHFEYLTILSLK